MPSRTATEPGYLSTGQMHCYDVRGQAIACTGSGHDGEHRRGRCWPEPRFVPGQDTVEDRLTDLVWCRDANPAEFPLTWQEALDWVRAMNRRRAFGFADWRLPNRVELRSLVSYGHARPALATGHPFRNVFPSWYWSSTTVAGRFDHAWYVHLDGARMFFGGKDQSFLVWPVRGLSPVLAATGQVDCYGTRGLRIPCADRGCDGELHLGRQWGTDRFDVVADGVHDTFTGVCWRQNADLTGSPSTWDTALNAVAALARDSGRPWRLPNINELESLVDCGRYGPALPPEAPFSDVYEGYWSSTTSMYEADWAWALYLEHGAVGVGQKRGRHFRVWPVLDAESAQGGYRNAE